MDFDKIEEETQVKTEQEDKVNDSDKFNKPKTGMGVAVGLAVGIIGGLVGLIKYPENTISRQTFFKGWGITCVIKVIFTILIMAVNI